MPFRASQTNLSTAFQPGRLRGRKLPGLDQVVRTTQGLAAVLATTTTVRPFKYLKNLYFGPPRCSRWSGNFSV